MPRPLDKFDCYELCAQAPEYEARMFRAIHQYGASARATAPRVLGEDFCGTAAISRAWIRLDPKHRAVAVDHDRPTLDRAKLALRALSVSEGRGASPGVGDGASRIEFILSDVQRVRARADIISVQNFSICEFHARPRLVAYLKHARSRLNRRGVFVCDIYAGADVFFTGRIHKSVNGPGGARIGYDWEQRTTDALRARVVNAMHFEIRPAAAQKRTRRAIRASKAKLEDSGIAPPTTAIAFHDAFVYDWRLWSPPELADAMQEAGFRRVQFFPRLIDAVDDEDRYHCEPIENASDLSDSFNIYVVARTVSGA